MHRRVLRPAVAFGSAAILAASLVFAAAGSVAAYGRANWQVTFAATGTAPSTGFGLGFWGWCDFAGGVASGNSGDCEVSQYFHAPAGNGFTCLENVNVTLWSGTGGTFVIEAATITVHPSSLTGPCLQFFPGPGGFPVDLGIPSAAGHYNFGGIGGVVGEFQATVVQIK